MNGSMHKVENGKYRVRWRDPNGRGRSRTFDRIGDAKRWLTHVRHTTALDELPLRPNKVTLGEHITEWWPRKKRELRPKTVAAYESIIRLHIPESLRARRLALVGPLDIEALLLTLVDQEKFALAQKVRAVVHGLFADAIRQGHIATNPVSHAQIPLRARETHTEDLIPSTQCLSPGSVWTLAEAAPMWAKAIILIGGFAGLRWGEMAGLGPEHIDLGARTIRVERTLVEPMREFGPPKTASSRRAVIFSDRIADDLAHHLATYSVENAAFPTPGGQWLHNSNFRRRVWLPTLRTVGLDGWRFHDLRHTYASILIKGGVSAPLVARMLGHSNASVTLSVYAGFWEEQYEDVRTALGL